jgi:protein-ribulosamine 3-kinase
MSDLACSLTKLIPSIESVEGCSSVGGGCISQACQVRVRYQTGDAGFLFVKSNAESFLDNFQAEWDGLVRLNQAEAIRVPEPITVGIADGRAWLVLQWINQGTRGVSFFESFACRLAALHCSTLGNQVGLARDNYLGSAVQINTPCEDWAEFFAEYRIGYQIRWAAQRGVDDRLKRDCEQIVSRMPQLLDGRDRQTSLLHGDLWSGNYLCDDSLAPVLIDPAVYHGCREAEFGMLQLFGGCPPSFYEAYQQQFPMPDGWQRRVQVYVLYHLLNHLNLFGSGYLGQCRSVAAEILRH